jgi:DNA polymerase II large subunit
MSDNMRNAEKEIVKIRRYVRRVWPSSSKDDHKQIVEYLLNAGYTTLEAVKEIQSDDHLIGFKGQLPIRFRILIRYNTEAAEEEEEDDAE